LQFYRKRLMTKSIGILLILFFALTSCTSSQRESAAWASLTPVAIIVGPLVVVSRLASDALSRGQRAEEWQAATNRIYLSKIEQIGNWAPAEDANSFWNQNKVVYWRTNNSRMRFTGLNPKSASGLADIDRETILYNYEVYSSNPELRRRAEVLANEPVGITYPRNYKNLNRATYACFEEIATKYKYLFNVQMASLTDEYETLPDYSEEITMSIEDPCKQVDLR